MMVWSSSHEIGHKYMHFGAERERERERERGGGAERERERDTHTHTHTRRDNEHWLDCMYDYVYRNICKSYQKV